MHRNRYRVTFACYEAGCELDLELSPQCPTPLVRFLLNHRRTVDWYKREIDCLMIEELDGRQQLIPWEYIQGFRVV